MEEVQKTRIKEMQEVDAKIEKINYDLLGIESRKKEIEDKKAEKQKEIEKLEKEKERLTMRSEDMNKARKVIYIIVEIAIKAIFNKFIFPAAISVNIIVKLRKGTIDNIGVVCNPTIKTIKLGKNDIKVNGVNAL